MRVATVTVVDVMGVIMMGMLVMGMVVALARRVRKFAVTRMARRRRLGRPVRVAHGPVPRPEASGPSASDDVKSGTKAGVRAA